MARGRNNSTIWLLAGLALILLTAAIEIGRQLIAPPPTPGSPQAKSRYAPDFKVGDVAPDFELPDHSGKPHRLSRLVHRDTLLSFICACASCVDVQTYTGILIKRMGPAAPDLITVTTMPKDREETYFRDTQLKQRLLYEPKEGPVMELYRGHPCPRLYRLRADRTVAWIGSSPGETPFVQAIGNELAVNLGFEPERADRPDFPGTQAPALEH